MIRNGNSVILEHLYRDRRTTTAILATPSDTVYCLQISSSAHSWDLLSGPVWVDTSCHTKAPRFWGLLQGSKTDQTLPSGWPEPFVGCEITSGNSTARYVQPFNDNRQAFLVSFGQISCMIIDGSQFQVDTPEENPLKEKLELLIIANADSSRLLPLRSSFRPRFLISLNSCPGENYRYENIIYAEKKQENVCFSINRNNSLQLK